MFHVFKAHLEIFFFAKCKKEQILGQLTPIRVATTAQLAGNISTLFFILWTYLFPRKKIPLAN